MSGLFDSFSLRGLTFKNRIGVSPMCQYSSENGHATDWHLVHLGSRAVGGAGLIVAEATAVSPEGRISPGDAGLWQDSQIEPLARIVRFVKQFGTRIGIQLAHAGRKASAARPWEGDSHLDDAHGGWQTVAPSAIAFGGNLPKVPTEMSVAEIKRVQECFKSATKRALDAGYEFIEFHGAHGYLAHEFYSPIANKRGDAYGGTFENRTRFIRESVEGVRSVMPDSMPLFVRLSCSDWLDGGWTIDDSIALSKKLAELGVDLIDCSSGFIDPNVKQIPFGPGFQVPFAERIKKEARIATAAVGVIYESKQAAEIVSTGKADIVLMAREMLREPYFAWKSGKDLGQPELAPLPVQYKRAVAR